MELSQSFCFNHKRFFFLILQYPKNDQKIPIRLVCYYVIYVSICIAPVV